MSFGDLNSDTSLFATKIDSHKNAYLSIIEQIWFSTKITK